MSENTRSVRLATVQAALGHPIGGDQEALAQILTGTAEVQVTIVATVMVPTDPHGAWLQADAVAAAAWAAREGRADYEAHEVTRTGAPGPDGEVTG